MTFKDSNGKEFDLDPKLRTILKPNWEEMLKPAKTRTIIAEPYQQQKWLIIAEENMYEHGIHLTGKDILEIGCGYGNHCFLMAKYEGTKVHGIDINEYTINQSPDMNDWNPKDLEFAQEKITKIRKVSSDRFPKNISDKVTFETCRIEDYATPNQHDLIFSFDVLEHILDLPLAFRQMANALKTGGIMYHEYNPFFSLNGGHSLCTLDFHYGHCRLSKEDFERYIREIRPEEEKIALNFYHKCLNRMTLKDLNKLVEDIGLEIIEFDGNTPFKAKPADVWESLKVHILPDVVKIYPDVTVEDLLWDSVHILLRKK